MEIIDEKGRPDFSQLIDLIKVEWPKEFGEVSEEEMIREMDKSYNPDTDRVKYLMDDGEIIGFYRYSLWPREDKMTKTVHTYDISILPGRQKQGLGTLLMRDMIDECRLKGFEKMLSRTFKSNKGSIKLHKSMDFTLHMETDDSYVWELIL